MWNSLPKLKKNRRGQEINHGPANPTPLSRNLLGNSITGAFTGIREVISPRHDITELITVPISKYDKTAPPGPATASDFPEPRNNPMI